MLAQAVRNTQPELNSVSTSITELKAKRRSPTARRPAKHLAKGRNDLA